MEVVIWILVGAITGWIVTLLTRNADVISINLITGIIGAILGGWVIAPVIAIDASATTGVVIAFLSAVALLSIVNFFAGPGKGV